jgi:hypothetical protein
MRHENPSYLDRLIRDFGPTDDPNLGGFILPDGQFLDLSEGASSRITDLRANARYLGRSYAQHKANVLATLETYAAEHRALMVYNWAQWHAREAAVELGLGRYDKVLYHLRTLKARLGSSADWVQFASQYRLGPDGEPEPFPWRRS